MSIAANCCLLLLLLLFKVQTMSYFPNTIVQEIRNLCALHVCWGLRATESTWMGRMANHEQLAKCCDQFLARDLKPTMLDSDWAMPGVSLCISLWGSALWYLESILLTKWARPNPLVDGAVTAEVMTRSRMLIRKSGVWNSTGTHAICNCKKVVLLLCWCQVMQYWHLC